MNDTDTVRIEPGPHSLWRVVANGRMHLAAVIKQGGRTLVFTRGQMFEVRLDRPAGSAAPESDGEFRAPMPGVVVQVMVQPGDSVEAGGALVVIEAMKTQQTFRAPFAGRVDLVGAQTGESIEEGRVLVKVVPEA
jgi:3-methylcrotonyl-CoA carboxylase alpha subunit